MLDEAESRFDAMDMAWHCGKAARWRERLKQAQSTTNSTAVADAVGRSVPFSSNALNMPIITPSPMP